MDTVGKREVVYDMMGRYAGRFQNVQTMVESIYTRADACLLTVVGVVLLIRTLSLLIAQRECDENSAPFYIVYRLSICFTHF